jgi:hypothetical protein
MNTYEVIVQGISSEDRPGSDLWGKVLKVVKETEHYIHTDDGSVWTQYRHGGYNAGEQQPYLRIERVVPLPKKSFFDWKWN